MLMEFPMFAEIFNRVPASSRLRVIGVAGSVEGNQHWLACRSGPP